MGFAICPVPAPGYLAIQRRASSLSVSSKIANLRRGERLAKVGHPFLPFLLPTIAIRSIPLLPSIW